MLYIELFGRFCLTANGEAITAVSAERQQALLAYLILNRGRPQPRQQIAFDLWPNLPDDQAKTSLRRELYRLRQSLPPIDNCLQIETKTLQWIADSPSRADVAEFEAHLHQAQAAQFNPINSQRTHLEQVAQLYQGKLLPSCDDEWILPLREQFHQKAFQAIERLIQILEQQQEYAAAIPLSCQLLRLDPLHEAGYQALMRLHNASGDRAAAVSYTHL
ncbi:6-hydroxy-D-nicotine oxidase, partial [filamentous cyanobacterium CCP1]